MGSEIAYGTNDAKVISEMLEGETIIINLETGNYYSLNDAASTVWNMMKTRATEEAMAAALVRAYEIDFETAAQAVQAFLGVLEGDLLIEKQDATSVPGPTDEPQAPIKRLPFVSPALQRYEDMQQMLLADPIHDVDEQGWPVLIKA